MNSLDREFNIAVSTTKISGTILAAANKDGSALVFRQFILRQLLLTTYRLFQLSQTIW